MTYTPISFVGEPVFKATRLLWAGGPVRLHMQRFPGNFHFPDDQLAILAPREQDRLVSAVRPEKAHRAMRTRLQLRLMLADVLGERPGEIELVTDDEGRPGLHPRYGIARDSLDFSVSYEPQGFAVCLAHGHRVGVDIQRFSFRQKRNFDRLFGGPYTRKSITRLEVQELWTRMEAYGKMQGEGLGHGMQRLYRIAIDPARAEIPCRFYDLRFGLGTSVAVCLSGAPAQLAGVTLERIDPVMKQGAA